MGSALMTWSDEVTIGIDATRQDDGAAAVLSAWRRLAPSARLLVAIRHSSGSSLEDESVVGGVETVVVDRPLSQGHGPIWNALLDATTTPVLVLSHAADVPDLAAATLEKVVASVRSGRFSIVGGAQADRPYPAAQFLPESRRDGRDLRMKPVEAGREVVIAADLVHTPFVLDIDVLRRRAVRWEDWFDEDAVTLDLMLSLRSKRIAVGHAEQFTVVRAEEEAEHVRAARARRWRLLSRNRVAKRWGVERLNIETSADTLHTTILDQTLAWPDLLGRVADALERHATDWWISNGTLLGYVRESDFLAHDHDMDVTALVPYVRMRGLARRLQAAGCRVSSKGTFRSGIVWRVVPEEPASWDGDVMQPRLDIFFARPMQSGGVVTVRFDRQKVHRFAYPLVRTELVTTTMSSSPVRAPADPEELLRIEYGDTWRTPEEHWSYLHRPSNRLEKVARYSRAAERLTTRLLVPRRSERRTSG